MRERVSVTRRPLKTGSETARLKRREQEWQRLFDALAEPIVEHDAGYRIVRANRAYAEQAGMAAEELIGRPYWKAFPKQDGPLPGCRAAMERGLESSSEHFVLPSGEVFVSRSYPVRLSGGSVTGGVHIFEEVTERWKVTQALDAAERRLRTIVETESDGIVVVATDGAILYVNPAAAALLGRNADELPGRPFGLPLSGEGVTEVELVARVQRPAVAEMRASALEWAGQPAFLIVLHDITERKLAEARLHRINRAYAVRSECNRTLAAAQSEEHLYQGFCEHLVRTGGYRFAWVGRPRHDAAQSIEPVAAAGENLGYLEQVQFTWGATPWGIDPVGEVIRTAAPVLVASLDDDQRPLAWRAETLGQGLHSFIGLPIRLGVEVVGELCIYTGSPEVFDPGEVRLLEALASDLAFGLQAARTRAARTAAESTLQIRNRAIEASLNGIIILEAARPEPSVLYTNPAFSHITGYAREEVMGRSIEFLHGDDTRQPDLARVQSAFIHQRENTALLRNYRKDGSLFWNDFHIAPVRDPAGEVTHYIGIINDVTEHKRYEEQLEFQAQHDALTGLPNRAVLQDRLSHALGLAGRLGRSVAVLFLDLDHFKEINDSLGHAVGDRVLQETAARLKGCAHGGETVARYGGDEFVIILPVEEPLDASRGSERYLSALAKPIAVEAREVQVSASIGAAVYPRDGTEPAILLRNADAAMFQAKELGRSRFQFYTTALNRRLRARLEMRNRLRRALEQKQLVLHYQPQVEMDSGAITGFEALVRMRVDGRLIYPGRFIALAEDSGLITPLGEWVLREACGQARAWQTAGLPAVTMGVNLSPRQFGEPGLPVMVQSIVAECGLEPGQLELELTESAFAKEPKAMGKRLRTLKELGILLAIDDFGTGYSSLSYLTHFPFDRLKIDRSFVGGLGASPEARSVTGSIIALAHSMRLKVIAEGCERQEHVDYLVEHGCRYGQGYLFSRPVPAANAEQLLKRQWLQVPRRHHDDRQH